MHILYLSQLVPYPPDAGPKVRIYHVLQYLASAGHRVTLVAFQRENDRPESLAHLRQFCHAVYTVPMFRSWGRDLWHLGRSFLNGLPFLIARDSVSSMHEMIQRLVTEQSFDAIHADQLWMAQYALGAQDGFNGRNEIKLVLDQHNAMYMIPKRLSSGERNPIKRLILAREARAMKRYEVATCERFTHVTWVTDEDRAALAADGAGNNTDLTIPICIDPSTKTVIERQPGARRVTFLGGLHWPPNAEGIVWFAREVWPRIQEIVPDALLTVIGKNPPRDLQMQDANLDVTGYVDAVEPYLAETAVFIVPLHAGGGMRVKIIDAWSWGLPVVSTTIGAEGLQYRHDDNLLIGDSAESFARQVIHLLQEPESADRVAAAGRRTAETTYDWRKIYPAWDQIYDKP